MKFKASLLACSWIILGSMGLISPTHAENKNNTIKSIVVFGDSLSDGGTYKGIGFAKAGTLNGTTYSPGGRFTTNPGKVWVEYLANFYNIILTPNRFTGPGAGPNHIPSILPTGGKNYAEGGAQVTESPGFDSLATDINGQLIDATGIPFAHYSIVGNECIPQGGTPVNIGITAASITDQMNRFEKENPLIQKDSLIIVQGGANDISKQLYGISKCGPAFVNIAQNNILNAGNQLVAQVNRLLSLGMKRIFIATIPDLSQTPFAFTADINTKNFLKSTSIAINTQLITAFSQNPHVKFARTDVFFANVLAHPEEYGVAVTNTATACNLATMYTYLSDYAKPNPDPAHRTTSSLSCNEIDYVNSQAPNVFAFADAIHPSSGIHQKFASTLYNQLQNTDW